MSDVKHPSSVVASSSEETTELMVGEEEEEEEVAESPTPSPTSTTPSPIVSSRRKMDSATTTSTIAEEEEEDDCEKKEQSKKPPVNTDEDKKEETKEDKEHNELMTHLENARKRVKKAYMKSNLLDTEKVEQFPVFDWREVNTGKILGRGSFGTVSEILKFRVTKENTKNPSFSFRSWVGREGEEDDDEGDDIDDDHSYYEGQFHDKRFIADNCVRRGGDARYALKQISPETKENMSRFVQAAMDMAIETHVLSVLHHPNVIKLRGVGQGDMFDSSYFLILDRLYDTLEAKLEKWLVEKKSYATFWGKCRGGKKKKLKLFLERLTVARDLSATMSYLHGHSIIYRDLKPDNIGFDVKNNVKIFDFGLAKELHPDEKLSNGTFKLTGETGSHPYMAPEVSNKRPYDFTADTYSFGILLWEIVSMKVAFEGYTSVMMKEMAINWGNRPDLEVIGSDELKTVIKNSWDADRRKRPNFDVVTEVLEKEIKALNQKISAAK